MQLPPPWHLIGYIPQTSVPAFHALFHQAFPHHYIAFLPEARKGEAAMFTYPHFPPKLQQQWDELCHAMLTTEAQKGIHRHSRSGERMNPAA